MILRPRAALMAIAVLAASTSLAGSPGSLAESATPPPNVTVSSVVLDQAGAPLRGAAVSLSGFVRRSDTVTDLVVIGRTTTDANGHFTISGDPSGLPSEGPNGAVSLELDVTAGGAGGGLIYDFLAIPLASGSVNWVADLPPAPVFRVGHGLVEGNPNAPAKAQTSRHGAESSFTSAADDPTVITNDVMTAPTATEAGLADEEVGNQTPAGVSDYEVDGEGGTSCPQGYGPIGYLEEGVYRYNYVPTKYFRSRGRALFKWEIGRSDETSLEIAINFNGSHYGGGTKYGSKDEHSLTHTVTAPHHSQKIFKVKWRYERDRKFCHEDLGLGHIWLLDVWRWLPDRAEAGNRFPDTGANFDCGGTGPGYVDWIAQPVQVAKSSSVNYQGFFSIIGASLDASQLDRTAQTLTITPDTSRSAKICGSNDTPAYANLVKEMSYG